MDNASSSASFGLDECHPKLNVLPSFRASNDLCQSMQCHRADCKPLLDQRSWPNGFQLPG